MILHKVDLSSLFPKGNVTCEYKDNILHMTTKRAIPTQRFDVEHLSINSFVSMPEKYRLPLRIDLRARIDAPGYICF